MSGRELLVAHGPTLLVRIGFDENFVRGNLPQPALPRELLPALVDTGASDSSIDSQLAQRLGLTIVDEAVIAGAGGTERVNMYLAQIQVPDLQITVYGRFCSVHLQAGNQQHIALIGRTFLQHFTMEYKGTTGSVTLRR